MPAFGNQSGIVGAHQCSERRHKSIPIEKPKAIVQDVKGTVNSAYDSKSGMTRNGNSGSV